MKIRVGFGFDVHQLVEGRELWLGGIRLEHSKGLLGHSDADVLLHTVCDALLGAANMRDIGYHFPDTAGEYKNIDSKILLKKTVDEFKEMYGVECFAALHHNKRKTNLHIHMIFAERKRLDQPEEKTATRNMFYDEQGRHVRTKKEILDSDGNIRKGCKIIKKGEVYEHKIFTIKDSRFKQESFLDEAKVFYTDLINQMVINDKDRLSIFDKNGPYLATKKVGKNNPKAEEIKADNEIRMEWNRAVDRAIVSGISETEVVELKKTEITEKVKESVDQNGNKPELFGRLSGRRFYY